MRGLPELLQGHQFRHGLSFIPVSSLARQYYCELKVDHHYTVGDIPTEAKEEGELIHERLLAMERVALQDFIREVESKPKYEAAFPVGARVGEIVVAGKPDLVIFHRTRPRYLVELKTTAGDPGRLWRDQAVQAKTYGLLMDLMGFDCSQLELRIAQLKRPTGLSTHEKKRLLDRKVEAIVTERGREASLGGSLGLFTIRYDRGDAEKDVLWAQGYWLHRRHPVPTKQPAKCRACEYRRTCGSSLAEE